MKAEVGSLRRRKGGRRSEDVADHDDEPGSAPEPQQQEAAPPEKEEAASGEDWFKAMREALDDRPEASVPSTEPPSSPSGSTGPTRFRWESAEGLVPMP